MYKHLQDKRCQLLQENMIEKCILMTMRDNWMLRFITCYEDNDPSNDEMVSVV